MTLHIVLGHTDYDIWERFLAGCVASLLFNVLWRYFASNRTTLPVLEWVIVQIYVFFAMPVFSEGTSTMSVSFETLSRSDSIRDALIASNLFAFFLIIGWAAAPRWRTHRTPTRAHLPLMILLIYGIASLVVAWLLNRYELEWKYGSYRQVVRLLFLPATAQLLLLFEYHRQPGSRLIRVALVVFTGLMVLVGLFSSRLSFALIPLITAGIGVLARGGKLPKGLALAVILLLVVVNPAKHVYRELTGYRTSTFSTQTIDSMVAAWIDSFTQTWSSEQEFQGEQLDVTRKRLNNLTVNAAVFAWVPERVGYAKGDPWLALPYSVIPRFLWPKKPGLTEITNDRFAIQFGMSTRKATERTTYAYPAVADGYWNFGWAGVALSAILAGVFWRIVSNAWTPNSRFRYVVPFFLLIDTRAIVALPNLLLGVLQTLVACFFVIKLLEALGALVSPRPR